MPRNRIVVRLAISLSCLMAMLLGAGVLGLFRTESINHERQSNVAKQSSDVVTSLAALNYSYVNNRITMECSFSTKRCGTEPTAVASRLP